MIKILHFFFLLEKKKPTLTYKVYKHIDLDIDIIEKVYKIPI